LMLGSCQMSIIGQAGLRSTKAPRLGRLEVVETRELFAEYAEVSTAMKILRVIGYRICQRCPGTATGNRMDTDFPRMDTDRRQNASLEPLSRLPGLSSPNVPVCHPVIQRRRPADIFSPWPATVEQSRRRLPTAWRLQCVLPVRLRVAWHPQHTPSTSANRCCDLQT
jgi:hypothetical protein